MRLKKITACGECCTGCKKHQRGLCPGCIEADGYVPEWAQSGRCRVHACARAHETRFCGVCPEFPCGKIQEMIPWNADIVEHLREISKEFQ